MTNGFVLGKFMPPHRGHIGLCDTAMQLVDRLTVLVCTLPDDPINGAERFDWMQRLLPSARVMHHDRIVPQQPSDHPDFWPIWRDICRTAHSDPIDMVFGSEPYITRLAAELGAQPVIVDPDRLGFPISGTAIRSNPVANWDMIPGPVRTHYQKRVILVGAESTGKTSLAIALASRFYTRMVPEYGRTYDAAQRLIGWGPQDFHQIALRHQALRRAIAPHAGPVLIEDTDPLQTAIWQQTLLAQDMPGPIHGPLGHLYLLLDTDLDWKNDGTRYHGDSTARTLFQSRCRDILSSAGASFVTLGGNWADRLLKATNHIETLMTRLGHDTT